MRCAALPLATTEANLRGIVDASQAAHAKVLLVGMYVPPNYGGLFAKVPRCV